MMIRASRVGALLVLPMLAVVLGCNDGITDSATAAEDPIPLAASVNDVGVVEFATGTGHSERPDGTVATIAFNAVKKADGRVNGQLLLENRWRDTRTKMDVDCLAVDGNVAVLSGVMTQYTYPQYEGIGLWFVAEDNGEGDGAPPDRATGVYVVPGYTPQPDYCHVIMADIETLVPPPGAIVGWVPVIRGNIQIRGRDS